MHLPWGWWKIGVVDESRTGEVEESRSSTALLLTPLGLLLRGCWDPVVGYMIVIEVIWSYCQAVCDVIYGPGDIYTNKERWWVGAIWRECDDVWAERSLRIRCSVDCMLCGEAENWTCIERQVVKSIALRYLRAGVYNYNYGVMVIMLLPFTLHLRVWTL